MCQEKHEGLLRDLDYVVLHKSSKNASPFSTSWESLNRPGSQQALDGRGTCQKINGRVQISQRITFTIKFYPSHYWQHQENNHKKGRCYMLLEYLNYPFLLVAFEYQIYNYPISTTLIGVTISKKISYILAIIPQKKSYPISTISTLKCRSYIH